ncbi:hypothetical protein FRACYDRAFT_246045 [Fragilariopsis cylindrus CCMP1102]|uniref:Uncharacterized protein n=1 Tax=Fragilariopsis cylindrus CCMP1102 TaxID=635003 RepID=A0A1E7EZZ7_9STRA|nr:hypothetical protein FRACYDRAFT_246045 [Fragilariopsis cylindrus CCMP1102]|eukprot:OEU11437.1 hypothetical protein FRACYDRAFT_246045 [Fragilariopsis cylindrus CCMP1102]
MVLFGIKTKTDLQNDLFCLQEERDYFESKFLEQVSEINALKIELKKSKKEVRRLRTYVLLDISNSNGNDVVDSSPQQQQHNIAEKDDASSLTLDAEELEGQNNEGKGDVEEEEGLKKPSRRNTNIMY